MGRPGGEGGKRVREEWSENVNLFESSGSGYDIFDLSPVFMKFVQIPSGTPLARLFVLGSWLFKVSVCSRHENKGKNLIEHVFEGAWVRSVRVWSCWINR